mgnify:CR=1 FL=1
MSINKPNLAIWLFTNPSKYKPISPLEEDFASKLSSTRSIQYRTSRAYSREVLSLIHSTKAIDIPLYSPPSKPPILARGLGYFSISHCKDALLLGWSKYPIGVDIERIDRKIYVEKLYKRFFSKEEVFSLENNSYKDIGEKLLDLWVVKESAIKWQRGNISSDLKLWRFDPKSSIVTHEKLGLKVRTYKTNLIKWKIAISYDLSIQATNPLICY